MFADENSGFYMPVAPAYSGGNGFGGFGGDWGWIVLLLLLGWNNNGFGGGMGGDIYPWLNQTTNGGFQNALLNDNITSVRDGIYALSTQLCNCCADTQMALANGFAGVEQGANARQMATMQSFFDVQSGISDLKYTVATENCADRTQSLLNTRDIIEAQTKGTQSILDKLCSLELDAKNDTIAQLRQQLNMADLKASQTAQNAFISQGFANEVDALYNRLNNCPVPTTPVYGRTPIFTCNNTSDCANNF